MSQSTRQIAPNIGFIVPSTKMTKCLYIVASVVLLVGFASAQLTITAVCMATKNGRATDSGMWALATNPAGGSCPNPITQPSDMDARAWVIDGWNVDWDVPLDASHYQLGTQGTIAGGHGIGPIRVGMGYGGAVVTAADLPVGTVACSAGSLTLTGTTAGGVAILTLAKGEQVVVSGLTNFPQYNGTYAISTFSTTGNGSITITGVTCSGAGAETSGTAHFNPVVVDGSNQIHVSIATPQTPAGAVGMNCDFIRFVSASFLNNVLTTVTALTSGGSGVTFTCAPNSFQPPFTHAAYAGTEVTLDKSTIYFPGCVAVYDGTNSGKCPNSAALHPLGIYMAAFNDGTVTTHFYGSGPASNPGIDATNYGVWNPGGWFEINDPSKTSVIDAADYTGSTIHPIYIRNATAPGDATSCPNGMTTAGCSGLGNTPLGQQGNLILKGITSHTLQGPATVANYTGITANMTKVYTGDGRNLDYAPGTMDIENSYLQDSSILILRGDEVVTPITFKNVTFHHTIVQPYLNQCGNSWDICIANSTYSPVNMDWENLVDISDANALQGVGTDNGANGAFFVASEPQNSKFINIMQYNPAANYAIITNAQRTTTTATLIATNNLVAGQYITMTGFPTGAMSPLNTNCLVLAAGLSGTGFQCTTASSGTIASTAVNAYATMERGLLYLACGTGTTTGGNTLDQIAGYSDPTNGPYVVQNDRAMEVYICTQATTDAGTTLKRSIGFGYGLTFVNSAGYGTTNEDQTISFRASNNAVLNQGPHYINSGTLNFTNSIIATVPWLGTCQPPVRTISGTAPTYGGATGQLFYNNGALPAGNRLFTPHISNVLSYTPCNPQTGQQGGNNPWVLGDCDDCGLTGSTLTDNMSVSDGTGGSSGPLNDLGYQIKSSAIVSKTSGTNPYTTFIFGGASKFTAINFLIRSVTGHFPTTPVTWKYSSGAGAPATWTTLTLASDNSSGLTVGGIIAAMTWADPGAGWVQSTQNGVTAYWVGFIVTGTSQEADVQAMSPQMTYARSYSPGATTWYVRDSVQNDSYINACSETSGFQTVALTDVGWCRNFDYETNAGPAYALQLAPFYSTGTCPGWGSTCTGTTSGQSNVHGNMAGGLPSNVYGDVSGINPQFYDPTRNPTSNPGFPGYCGLTPGSALALYQDRAKIWNGTNTPACSVLNELKWYFDGFMPRELMLRGMGHGGQDVGPVQMYANRRKGAW